MRFAAAHHDFTRVAPFVVASMAARGTWISAYAYAASVEKQGRIPVCAGWDDRQWMGAAGVMVADVAEAVAAGLLIWNGPDLIVIGYDLDGEAKVAAARENGRRPTRDGKRRGRRPKSEEERRDKTDGKPGANRPVSPGKTQDKPTANPSASSVSETVTKAGGGGSPPPVGEEHGEPEPDLEAAVAAIRAARDREAASNPQITTTERSADLQELRAALRPLPPGDLALAGKVARLYFTRTGRDPKDTFWRDRGWSLHLFATQGIESCMPHARLGIKRGWPDDYDLAEARDRLGAKAAGAAP